MSKEKNSRNSNKKESDILETLDLMEATITQASSWPLSNKILIEKDDLLDYIQEIRTQYPAAMREAKWIKNERERILNEAKQSADSIRKSAEQETLRLIDEHQITIQANNEAEKLRKAAEDYVEQMKENAEEVKKSAEEFADDVFKNIENKLEKLMDIVHKEHEEYINK